MLRLNPRASDFRRSGTNDPRCDSRRDPWDYHRQFQTVRSSRHSGKPLVSFSIHEQAAASLSAIGGAAGRRDHSTAQDDGAATDICERRRPHDRAHFSMHTSAPASPQLWAFSAHLCVGEYHGRHLLAATAGCEPRLEPTPQVPTLLARPHCLGANSTQCQ